MKNYLRLICMVIAASSLGVISDLAVGQPGPGWQYGMGPAVMGGFDGRSRHVP